MSYYNVIVAMGDAMPMTIGANSEKDLLQEYKDAVINQSKFLTWETGMLEMKNVLGVYY